MATPQLSPGVLTREVDLTVGRAENVLDNIGAIAGPFTKGPVSEPVIVSTEQELINTFGKPSNTDNQYEYWLSGSSYLSYGGVLNVVRTDGETLRNANVGIGTTAVALKIKNFDDYNTNFLNGANTFYYAAKNPGTWANSLKVCFIDDFADQIVGIATTSLANLGVAVGYGVTVDIRGNVIPGTGTTAVFDGYLKGIVVDFADNVRGQGLVYVKILSRVSAAGTEYPITYSEGNSFASIKVNDRLSFVNNSGITTSPQNSIESVGVTTFTAVNGQQDEVYTGVGGTTNGAGNGATFTVTRNSTNGGVLSVAIVNPGINYSTNDTVSIAGTSVGGFNLSQGVISTVAITTSTTLLAQANATYTVAGVSTVGSGASFTVYRNASGGIGTVTVTNPGSGYNQNEIITIPGNNVGGVVTTDDLVLSVASRRNDTVVVTITNTKSSVVAAKVTDWYNEQQLGLTNSTIYWSTIAPKPGTSAYVAERGGKNDEMHIVVVDDTGEITGIQGNILEKHVGLSKAKDAVSQVNSPQKIWYKNFIANFSSYIYAGGNASSGSDPQAQPKVLQFRPSGTVIPNVVVQPTGFDAYSPSECVWDSSAQGHFFSSIGAFTYELIAGQDYSLNKGLQASLGSLIDAYELFNNKEEVRVDYLINGPSLGSQSDSQAKANKLIAVADSRKDCVAVISPHKENVVDITNTTTQTNNVIGFFSPLTSSSYAIFDSGYKYTYDRFNNQFRYIPCNADIAGLMCRTNLIAYPWFSPAGIQRGVIKNAIKLAYNPSKVQRDALYGARINPIINQAGSGIVLFGDKTALAYASAFDRINVRRLFLTIEQSLERAAQAQLFEFNDQITRANFVNIVEPYLRDVQAKRGIYDFLIICDETNNTPDVIDNNEFRADIFLKPAKSINYITLTFVATRTGVSFEEVAGRV